MDPLFHTAEELQFLSNLGHWVEGGILAVVAVIAFLQAINYSKLAQKKYLWPGLVLFAGIFLWIFIVVLQPFYHGWANTLTAWGFILKDTQERQHLIMATLLILGGWAELKYRKNPDSHGYLQSAWPVILAAIGVMFILHPQHGTNEAMAKAHMFHQYLGFVFISAGVLKKVETKSQKRWLKFAWIIPLAIAAIMLMSYREPEGAYQQMQMPNNLVSSSQVNDQTITWRSYNSGVLGFQLKYPPDWEINQTATGIRLVPNTPSVMTRAERASLSELWPSFAIEVSDSTAGLTAQQIFDQKVLPGLRKDMDHKVISTIIGKIPAISYVDLGMIETQNYLTLKDAKVLHIYFSKEVPNDKLSHVPETFSQILATLAFAPF